MPQKISRAEMLTAMRKENDQDRNYEFWQNVFSSFMHIDDAPSSADFIQREVTAEDAGGKNIAIEGGLLNWPNTIVTANGVPLKADRDFTLTITGISTAGEYDFVAGQMLLIIRKK